MKTSSTIRAVVVLLLGWTLAMTAPAAAELVAPMGSHPPPPSYFLLRLVGDSTDVRYTPGSLDRAANVQTRLELTARAFRKWAKVELRPEIYVLSREKWQEAGYAVPYGLPVRVGATGLAVPAAGDAETVALWSALLDGLLPAIHGTPILGTPEEVATMILADVIVQLLASEMLLDALGLQTEAPWVRGLAAHAITVSVMARIEPDRLASVALLYQRLGERHPPGALSPHDLEPGVELADWLWFQAQLHAGGTALAFEGKKGKDLIQSLRKLQKRGGGVLTDELLLRRYKPLRPWLSDRFSAVSFRTD